MAADGYVCTDPKNVYALVIECSGATVGDKIAFRDGGPTGTVRLGPIKIPATAGMWPVPLGRYGVEFLTSVYYTELVTAGTKVRVTVIYD
jgi:hypothetical protein